MRFLTVLVLLSFGCSDIKINEENPVFADSQIGKADSISNYPEPYDVPYFYQYNNDLHPESSCQNTSVAMVLSYLGWDGVPDDITEEWGKDYAQEPNNLRYLFNTLSNEHWLRGVLWSTTDGTLEDFRSSTSQGNIVIVHGYFTEYGHVLVVTGRDAEGNYVVNDPAGRWGEVFKGGYDPSGPEDGKGIVYPKEDFEAAVSTSDGAGFMPLWYHILVEL